jgi:hypothetical protein
MSASLIVDLASDEGRDLDRIFQVRRYWVRMQLKHRVTSICERAGPRGNP